MGGDVPTHTELGASYEDVPAALERYTSLAKAFKAKFGEEPELFARAPGGMGGRAGRWAGWPRSEIATCQTDRAPMHVALRSGCGTRTQDVST
jgi:hypothetical protein